MDRLRTTENKELLTENFTEELFHPIPYTASSPRTMENMDIWPLDFLAEPVDLLLEPELFLIMQDFLSSSSSPSPASSSHSLEEEEEEVASQRNDGQSKDPHHRQCKIKDCTRVNRGFGLCGFHGGGKRCHVDKCDKASRKKGMCSGHFREHTSFLDSSSDQHAKEPTTVHRKEKGKPHRRGLGS